MESGATAVAYKKLAEPGSLVERKMATQTDRLEDRKWR
jgi:hypothetical protein